MIIGFSLKFLPRKVAWLSKLLYFSVAADPKQYKGGALVFKKKAETHDLQSVATAIEQIKKKSKDLERQIKTHSLQSKRSFSDFDDIEHKVAELKKEQIDRAQEQFVSDLFSYIVGFCNDFRKPNIRGIYMLRMSTLLLQKTMWIVSRKKDFAPIYLISMRNKQNLGYNMQILQYCSTLQLQVGGGAYFMKIQPTTLCGI